MKLYIHQAFEFRWWQGTVHIRECGSVLYLGMAREILILP